MISLPIEIQENFGNEETISLRRNLIFPIPTFDVPVNLRRLFVEKLPMDCPLMMMMCAYQIDQRP